MQFPRGSALVIPRDHAHASRCETRRIQARGLFTPVHCPTTRYPQVCAFKVWLSDSMTIQSICATPQRRHVTVPRSTLLHPLSLRELRIWEWAKVLRVAGGQRWRLAQSKDETMLYTTSRLGRSTGITTAQYRARQLSGRKTLSVSGLALKMISRQICHDCLVKQASASCLFTWSTSSLRQNQHKSLCIGFRFRT
jgi:hypothetical protein